MTLVLITNEYTASESLIMGVSNYHAYECFIVERWKVHLGCWIFVGQLFASLFTFFWSAILNWVCDQKEYDMSFERNLVTRVLNTFITFSFHQNFSQGTEKGT